MYSQIIECPNQERSSRYQPFFTHDFIFFHPSHFVGNKPAKSEVEEILNLLGENIQQRVNWEHQKLLLNNEDAMGEEEEGKKQNCQNIVKLPDMSQKLKTEKSHKHSDPESGSSLFYSLQQELIIKSDFPQHEKVSSSLPAKCNCKKTQCLKMYCECFRSGNYCVGCACQNCHNQPTKQNQLVRERAIQIVKQKKPSAFEQQEKYRGCCCNKSQCQKKYCQCFINGHLCGKYCRCVNCANCRTTKQRKCSGSSSTAELT